MCDEVLSLQPHDLHEVKPAVTQRGVEVFEAGGHGGGEALRGDNIYEVACGQHPR
jgi:hypothetical protein